MTMHVDKLTLESVDRTAFDRILKTRTDIILTHRFYGVLISNVEPVLSRKFPTAGTNGKKHYFNPDFVVKLNRKELKFVQRHESEHDARHHSTRRGNRDPLEWNISCDFAINIDLVDEIARGADMEVPREEVLGGKIWVDAKYRGMSAEDIYRSRELDRQRAEQEKQKQQPQPEDGDGEADDEDDASDAGDEDTETDEAGDEAGNDGDGNEPSRSSNPEDGSDGDADEGNGDSGDEADGDETEGDGGKGDEADEDGDEDGDGTGDGDEEGEATTEPESVTGEMPGGLGEVLDATDDPAEATEEEAKWERVVRQAASIAAKAGDLPGHITREIDRANQPKQDWREVLRAYFDQGATRVETWNRPNRRFVGSGMILPGTQREGLNSVVFLVDTSGSVDEVALKCVAAEAQAALDEGIIDTLHVVYGDTRVTRTDEYAPGDEIEFDPRGGGGTRMKPLFDWANENVDDTSLIVCFTDLEIESEEALGERPACPVLWAVHGYPERVREYLTRTPWNEPGIDVGSH